MADTLAEQIVEAVKIVIAERSKVLPGDKYRVVSNVGGERLEETQSLVESNTLAQIEVLKQQLLERDREEIKR